MLDKPVPELGLEAELHRLPIVGNRRQLQKVANLTRKTRQTFSRVIGRRDRHSHQSFPQSICPKEIITQLTLINFTKQQLDAAKRFLVVSQQLGKAVELLEQFAIQHAHFVNNQNLHILPARLGTSIFLDPFSKFTRCLFSQADARPRMQRRASQRRGRDSCGGSAVGGRRRSAPRSWTIATRALLASSLTRSLTRSLTHSLTHMATASLPRARLSATMRF